MNKQINELKEQAKEKVVSHGAFGETEIYWEINVDKFAKLLEKEYIKNCRDMFLVNSVSWNLLNEKLEATAFDEFQE